MNSRVGTYGAGWELSIGIVWVGIVDLGLGENCQLGIIDSRNFVICWFNYFYNFISNKTIKNDIY